mmetsp:Transcript_75630/g.216544  ORF Transcript_75630/g.216544 Transcript_75630/m.216544 type:complete len:309 (+) Transcript_75630:492-1418(+)
MVSTHRRHGSQLAPNSRARWGSQAVWVQARLWHLAQLRDGCREPGLRLGGLDVLARLQNFEASTLLVRSPRLKVGMSGQQRVGGTVEGAVSAWRLVRRGLWNVIVVGRLGGESPQAQRGDLRGSHEGVGHALEGEAQAACMSSGKVDAEGQDHGTAAAGQAQASHAHNQKCATGVTSARGSHQGEHGREHDQPANEHDRRASRHLVGRVGLAAAALHPRHLCLCPGRRRAISVDFVHAVLPLAVASEEASMVADSAPEVRLTFVGARAHGALRCGVRDGHGVVPVPERDPRHILDTSLLDVPLPPHCV